ncbi:cystathionine beta-synthase [Winogradskyella litorisediminis]|uniref:Cystathionine beta-synthase n=1 Tax=Winogradskyella litorisediminis TaxID=1156618 RepID=A0ABW3N5V9_9FLAO
MQQNRILNYIKNVLKNKPSDWVKLTTHRLDIYNESLAKTQFLEYFENLFSDNNYEVSALENLPTAYDYIRLGHPLSCVLEWTIAKLNNLDAESVISFDSKTVPVLSILRKNLLDGKATTIYYSEVIPEAFKTDVFKTVYGYNFEVKKVESISDISKNASTSVFISNSNTIKDFNLNINIDILINSYGNYGSILLINGKENKDFISEIQHVRRRETVAMTPLNCLEVLEAVSSSETIEERQINIQTEKQSVLESLKKITYTSAEPLVASSGLSMQYAIMMGLIDDAQHNYPNKPIRFLVPPNCYGGTNDQARRVAACLDNVEILDLPVDGENDMVKSVDNVLEQVAKIDGVPFIIAEIPTNPRVEVPNLDDLKTALKKKRTTKNGETAIDSVFILDQTFCPNVNFLGENKVLSEVRALSYSSGSKFPSGGLCTAGYCVVNNKAEALQNKIAKHLGLCDNEATVQQYQILAKQLPSMLQRIDNAYKYTREFVNFIKEKLPEAKINFVSEELASHGFTPSVFSLDLPTKGETPEEKENYKRELNHKLINLMITEIPDESKYCVSYGQLKGCYWTIPATSTQGTTKEGDKDYIARVALSGNMDLEKHKAVFQQFVNSI